MSDGVTPTDCFLFKLKAQTVKWFKLPDEQFDPLMSLETQTLVNGAQISLCRHCVRVKVHGATRPLLGSEVPEGILVVRMGSCQESGWTDGRGRAGYPGGSREEDRMRETRRREHIAVFFSRSLSLLLPYSSVDT